MQDRLEEHFHSQGFNFFLLSILAIFDKLGNIHILDSQGLLTFSEWYSIISFEFMIQAMRLSMISKSSFRAKSSDSSFLESRLKMSHCSGISKTSHMQDTSHDSYAETRRVGRGQRPLPFLIIISQKVAEFSYILSS